MKRNIYLLSIILLLLVQSCSTVNIASNKQQGYNKQPKKIFIVVNCNKDVNIFCTGLVYGLTNKLTEKGVQSDGYVRDPLSLESEEDRNKRINAYNPEAVLTVQQTLTGSGKGVFELTLIDGESRKNVWKSELEVSADSYTSLEDSGVIDKAVKTLVSKLAEDKII